VNLREFLDALADIHIARGPELPILNEEGLELLAVEYNSDDEPCILLEFEEPNAGFIHWQTSQRGSPDSGRST